jgi:hypothetical protein
MSQARITVGLPIYQAAEQIAATLESLQAQTYGDFDAIISVDGNDQRTADACRPFLSDSRFRMVVHQGRLDWFGNFNWLLRQPLNEFFCYRQHDDTTRPEFFEVLLRAADQKTEAAAVYCDCQWVGGRDDVEIAPSIEGTTLDRMLQYIERLSPQPVRGLIRREAIGQAGLVRHDEFRALSELGVWLAKLVRWGGFVRVPQALYLRLDHDGNYHKTWFTWPPEKQRAAWTTMFTGLLEAAMPVCRTPEERLFLQHVILDRVVVYRPERGYIYQPDNDPDAGGRLIAECLERLTSEGNRHLLGPEEIPALLQTEFRVAELKAECARLEAEVARLDRSPVLRLGRKIAGLLWSSAASTPAASRPPPARAPAPEPRFRAAEIQTLDGVTFGASPATVPPGPRGATVTLAWDARASGVEAVRIFVKGRTGEEQLFAESKAVGSQETGPWVTVGTVFVMKDLAETRQLARLVVGDVRASSA